MLLDFGNVLLSYIFKVELLIVGSDVNVEFLRIFMESCVFDVYEGFQE